MNDAVNSAARIMGMAMAVVGLSMSPVAVPSVMLIPTAITSAVPMSMCWSSFWLNLNPLLGMMGA